ncbi:MAG: pitrilysin family protein [Balneolaceae bacterium]
MKRLILFTFIVMLVLPLSAQKRYDEIEFPEINPIQMPDVEVFNLDNGTTFYLVEDNELPLINMRITIKTGSILEPENKTGLASMTGSVMREGGSTNYPADELNELLENNAASMSTFIGMGSGGGSLNILKEDFDELLPVFVDLLQNPAFPEDKIDLAKTQTNSSISRRNDEQQQIGYREFQNLVYGENTVYTREKEYETIDNITRDDLINFHKEAFVASNLTVGVVGDFDSGEMKVMLEKAFGSLPSGKETNLLYPEVDYDFPTTVNFIDKPDVNQSFVTMGHIGGLRESPDYAALQVMNQVLSGGFSSRLFQEVRSNLGLAYSVGGSYGSNINYPGIFRITTMTKSSTTAEAIDAIIKEVKKLQDEPVTEKELRDTKDQFLNSLVFRYDSKSKILNERINNEYNGLSQDAFDEFVEGVKATTIEDIQRVAKEYLRPDNMQILVVGNAEEIGNQLEKYGEINEVDISIPEPPSDEEPAVAGDAEKGKEWLRTMADAVINPDTEFESIDEIAVVIQETQMGAMEIQSSSTTNYRNITSERIMQTPQGEMQMSIENGGGTLTMMGNEQPLPPQMAQPMINEIKRSYISVSLDTDNLNAEYLGDETVDGTSYVLLRVDLNPQVTFLIDPETGLPARSRYSEMNPQTGQQAKAENVYADWQVVDGVAYAYSVTSYVDGEKGGEMNVESHSVNK